THQHIKTIYPDYPKPFTTITTSTCIAQFKTIITATTTVTVFTSTTYMKKTAQEILTLKKRKVRKVIYIPNKKYITFCKHEKCIRVFYCTLTVILECPPVRTKIYTVFTWATSLFTTTTITTTTISTIFTSFCSSACVQTSETCSEGPFNFLC
ncbi:6213_t:CDS:1, partial [Dentiscutata erythropus]